MSSLAPPGSAYSSIPAEDPYFALLSRTRDLQTEQRGAREAWLRELELEGKEELLFELEVLLKSAACFANPRNHPGLPSRTPLVAQDFRDAAMAFRDGMSSAIGLARSLLGARDRAFVFHRYLETVLPQDNVRTRLAREGFDQSTPDQSLVALRYGIATGIEVLEGALRGQRVPFRLFYALLTVVQREVGRNAFFNPLNALEFRPEFDRIRSGRVLDLIRGTPNREAHRLVALTFLSLFRILRYVRLLEKVAAEGSRRRLVGRAYLTLSVMQSDARALGDYLRQHGAALLAAGFDRDLFAVSAPEIHDRAPRLLATGHHLLRIRGALEAIAGILQLETRRTFQHEVPSLDLGPSEGEVRAALLRAVANLRPALQNAVLFLGRTLGATLRAENVFDDLAALRDTSDRLRRDVWMFAQIVRAFTTKAQHSPPQDRWAPLYGFQYVREFLGYFRAMGYPVLRATDYPRVDSFVAAVERLTDQDLVDTARLGAAVAECQSFHGFLLKLFEDISQRECLRETPFDRKAAVASLKLYLGS